MVPSHTALHTRTLHVVGTNIQTFLHLQLITVKSHDHQTVARGPPNCPIWRPKIMRIKKRKYHVLYTIYDSIYIPLDKTAIFISNYLRVRPLEASSGPSFFFKFAFKDTFRSLCWLLIVGMPNESSAQN